MWITVMVEAEDLKKNEKKERGGKMRWGWAAIGAVFVVLVAISITFKYTENSNSCQCAQVWITFSLSNLNS